MPSAIIDNRTGIELLLVRPGEFAMGDTSETLWEDSLPVHRVRISRPFYLGRYEVSEREYRILCGAHDGSGDPRLPARGMNWYEASAAAEKGGFRLPTEAEWEYACRAGSRASLYGELGRIAWYEANSVGIDPETGNSVPMPHRVGEKAPNDWGFFDMIGNVEEWCADTWSADAYSGLEGKVTTDPYLQDPACKDRDLRGGASRFAPVFLGAGIRGRARANLQNEDNGFRVARDP